MRLPLLLLFLLLPSVAFAQIQNKAVDPAQKPTTRDMNCTNGGCHAAQIDHKFLHGPNAVKACEACHDYADPAKHTFEFKRQGKELCEFCHIDKSGTEGTVVHKPVATGDCTGCHDPHGANTRKMLKKDTTPEMCAQCHKDTMSGSHRHGPAAADCTICHQAHTSNFPGLLVMEKQALCTNCHEDVGKMAKGAKHPHHPAQTDCLKCHSPHSSNQASVLSKPAEELCASCHQKTVDSMRHAEFTHSPTKEGKACLNCHVPHGSEWDKQLAQNPVGSCLQCHDKPIQVSKDRTVVGVPEIGVESMHKHGAIEKGDCSGCHNVHGGQNSRLLIANYSNTFYLPYNDKAYELCFKCHSKELAKADVPEPQTRFRDGDRNLHAVHVTLPKQGRNCRSCHSLHASKFSQLINDTVPFGAWKLPINFVPTETGGSCSPGCHEPQKYDRSKGKMGNVLTPVTITPAGDAPPGTPPNTKNPSDGDKTKP